MSAQHIHTHSQKNTNTSTQGHTNAHTATHVPLMEAAAIFPTKFIVNTGIMSF